MNNLIIKEDTFIMNSHNQTNNSCSSYPVIYSGYRQQGFTLIELLVTLILGLLISAAALQIFLTSSQSSNNQQASSQIQDNIVFGINQMTKHIRRANYGALDTTGRSGFFLTHSTPQGGIVLTAPTANKPTVPVTTNLDGLILNGSPIAENLLSRSAVTDSNLKGVKSDQLTIQYLVALDDQFDCQGREAPKGYYVIERYFVRVDGKRKALACASTNYKYDETLASTTGIDIAKYTKKDGSTADAQFTGNGSVIIPNVDYFRVLYGITENKNFATDPSTMTMRYVPADATPAVTFDGQRIASVQIGLVIGSESAINSGIDNKDMKFNVLDKRDLELNTTAVADKEFLREAYESTILIRNGRGRD